jgi:hydroxyacylglutathione hydrolase
LPDPSGLRRITAARLASELCGGALILDTRSAEQFASLHIRGSIQISLKGNFASWAAILIDRTQKLVLIVEAAEGAKETRTRLARVGLGKVIGYSLADENEWRRTEALDLASIAIERCEEIRRTLQFDPYLQLVDVRSRAEWLQGHLPGAISMPLLDLGANKGIIDPVRPGLLYCYEGFRATTAASILLRDNPTDNIRILVDGIEGWSALGLPLETPNASSEEPSLR